jgi:hypothetical protein
MPRYFASTLNINPLETSIFNQNINRSILEQVYDYCRKKTHGKKKLDIVGYVQN